MFNLEMFNSKMNYI